EPIAAARNGFDDGLAAIANGLTRLAHAMCQDLIAHDYIRPDRLDQFLLGHKTASVFNEVAQNLHRLWTQHNVAIRNPQGAARDIQRVSLELKHLEAAP